MPNSKNLVRCVPSREECRVNKSESYLLDRDEGSSGLVIGRLATEVSYKTKAYSALKQAITRMDLYSSPEPIRLDERELSERLGVSRTPVREAVAMLEREGFLRTVPRRGIHVVRKTKPQIVEMIQAWAALESMAARLAATRAELVAIAALRAHFAPFGQDGVDPEHLGEYSLANIAFHQSLISLSGSALLTEMTDNLFVHVRAIRHKTIFERDRAQRSIRDHIEIIEALEARDPESAERLSRDHTLRLADHVEKYVDLG
jgi:DNA-binding GntR family transcriptional regulator